MWHPLPSRARSMPRRSRSSHSRRTSLERLEGRRLLSTADFELSSLLSANGGDGSKGFAVSGIVDQGKLGSQLVYQPVGDVNGDGIDDLLLAAPGQSSSGVAPPTEAYAYLIFGRSSGFPADLDLHSLDGVTGYVLHDPVAGDSTGFAGGGVGDLNHDGIPDLALGAIWASPAGRLNAGETFVLYGGLAHLAALDLADGVQDGHIELSALDGTNGFFINGAAGDYSGRAVGAGDVNGDHVDDLVIGANGGLPITYGRSYVVFGRDSAAGQSFPATLELSSLNGSNGFVVPGIDPHGSLGNAVAKAGDVNGDGISDLVLGAMGASPSSGRAQAGETYVIFGRTSFPASFNLTSLNGSNGFTVNGVATNDLLGYSVAGAGDVNGDGLADVAIGGVSVDGPAGANSGAAYVVFGRTGPFPASFDASTLNGLNGFAMFGAAAFESAGSTVGGIGDVNRDGYADIAVGAWSADPNGVTDAGRSYVVYGGPSFGGNLNLAGLLAANGGDASAGYALNGYLAPGTSASGSAQSGAGYVAGIGDVNGDGYPDFRVASPFSDLNGLTDNGQAFIVYGKPSPAPATKFYVVNDAATDRTYEYAAGGNGVENYALNGGNTAPRGAASTAAGNTVWVVDANKNVYVYNTSGGLLGSWAAGSLASNATPEGIATNGTDVWIVDARQGKVFRYANAAGRLSGSQNAASSFSLNSGNTSPKDLVTDGVYLWVVNDSTIDKVFKYTLSGSLVGSWTIAGAGSSPTGITLDPSGSGQLWVVDIGTKRVYQFDNARGRTSGSQAPSTSFALAAGNTNPQGIADPPAPAAVTPRANPGPDASHPSAAMAEQYGRTIPGVRSSKSPGSPLALAAAPASTLGRQETPIPIPLPPPNDQDLTSLANQLIRSGRKRSQLSPRS
jgi:hypothetical protein